jgi:hypothetical protein
MNKPLKKERLHKTGTICCVYGVFALLLSMAAFGGHNPIWIVLPAFVATLTCFPVGFVGLACLIGTLFAKSE